MSNNNTYVSFSELSRTRLGKQCQYASRYFCKTQQNDFKFLGEGLRIIGNSQSYHTMQIHKDDIEEAIKRYLDFNQVTIDEKNIAKETTTF